MSDNIVVKELFPPIPSSGEMFMLEAMTYKITLHAQPLAHVNPDDVIVEVWTNQFDRYNGEGEWHGVRLTLLTKNSDCLLFGESEIITSDKDFQFKFRAKLRSDADYVWLADSEKRGRVTLAPARENDAWTQGANWTHIINSIHCGNFIAAVNAKECGFTHVLNVAGNLDTIYKPGQEVNYKKVGMIDGGHNPIPAELLKQAVEWLREVDKPENKVLVNCRAGIGRAGSTTIAYVCAVKEEWTYEECKEVVLGKRFVYPHKGLKEAIYSVFPRKGE